MCLLLCQVIMLHCMCFLCEIDSLQGESLGGSQEVQGISEDHGTRGQTHYSAQQMEWEHGLELLHETKELTAFVQETVHLLPHTQDVKLLTHPGSLTLVRTFIGGSTENRFAMFPSITQLVSLEPHRFLCHLPAGNKFHVY